MTKKSIQSVFMPYCLEQQADGRYAILNRAYKPVGFLTSGYIKYDDYPVLVTIEGLTEAKVTKISFDGNSDCKKIYLYDDGCNPNQGKEHMKSYLQKLELLSKLIVE